jgi:hypothetical protein
MTGNPAPGNSFPKVKKKYFRELFGTLPALNQKRSSFPRFKEVPDERLHKNSGVFDLAAHYSFFR